MKKLFTLIIALFAMVAASMADEITNVWMTYRVNNGSSVTRAFYASGVSTLELTDENITSLKLVSVKVFTDGNVSDVNLCGTIYNSGSTPSASSWASIPTKLTSGGYWQSDIQGQSIEMIESGWAGKTKVFEFYAKAKNGSGSDIYYNNGGQNYKIQFTVGSGASSDWTVKYYSESTATLDLTWNGTTNKNYSYNGEGVREQFYGENPGEVSSFTINGFTTRFIYNKDAGIGIQNVTLQYRINVDGAEGQWNGLQGTLDKEETIWNPEKERYEYRRIYSASNLNFDVVSAYGLETGHNYELQLMYQVVTTAGDYILLKQDANDMKLAFTISEQSAAPTYKGMTVTLTENGTEYADIDVSGGSLVSDGCTSLVLNNFKVTLGGENIEAVRLYWRVYPDEIGGGSSDIQWNSVDATVRNGEVWSDNCNIDLLGSGVNIEIPEGLQSNKAYRFYCYIAPLVSGTWLQSQEWGDLRIDIKTGNLTAVEGVSEAVVNKKAPKYSVAGARVGDGYKGIVIQGGKKVMQ